MFLCNLKIAELKDCGTKKYNEKKKSRIKMQFNTIPPDGRKHKGLVFGLYTCSGRVVSTDSSFHSFFFQVVVFHHPKRFGLVIWLLIGNINSQKYHKVQKQKHVVVVVVVVV